MEQEQNLIADIRAFLGNQNFLAALDQRIAEQPADTDRELTPSQKMIAEMGQFLWEERLLDRYVAWRNARSRAALHQSRPALRESGGRSRGGPPCRDVLS